jgi:peptidoglycan-associated lipoprotein
MAHRNLVANVEARAQQRLVVEPPEHDARIVVAGMGIIFLAGACHKKHVAAVTPPPAPAPAPAPTVSLKAEPSSIEKGKSVTLSWISQNTTELALDPDPGEDRAQGSATVNPDDSTTCRLTATGPGGTRTAVARVTVTAPPPPPPAAAKSEASEADLF